MLPEYDFSKGERGKYAKRYAPLEETPMTLAMLLPQVQALPRSDKLQLMQILAAELAQEHARSLLRTDVEYRVESQFDTQGADKVLQQILDNRLFF
jgi:hypothetical protein